MMYPQLSQYRRAVQDAITTDDDKRTVAQLYAYLRLFELFSPHIRGLINVRSTGLVALDWIISNEDGTVDERTQTARILLGKAIDTILRHAYRVDLYGVLGFAIMWQKTAIGWKPQLSLLPAGRLEVMSDGTIAMLPSRLRVQTDDYTKIASADAAATNGGMMISIGYLEIMRDDILREWANYNRKLKGLIHGIDRGASEQERMAAEQALQQAILHNYMITSDLIDIKLDQLASSQGAQSFSGFLDYVNRMISIAICGQANVSDLPQRSGSRAALVVQRSITRDIIMTDSVYAADMIGQLIAHYSRLNFGGDRGLTFAFDYSFDDDDETASVVIRNALQSGIPLRRDEVYRRLGYTQPQEGDDVITALTPTF